MGSLSQFQGQGLQLLSGVQNPQQISPAAERSTTPSLAGFHISLPADIQSSILGSVLEEVYVFVIENGKADDLKTFLENSGFKNVLSKKENDLTTVTAQKEQVFPEKSLGDESASPDEGCNTSQIPDNKDCGTITDEETCSTSYEGGICPGSCPGSGAKTNCSWNGGCSNGGGQCSSDTCNCYN